MVLLTSSAVDIPSDLSEDEDLNDEDIKKRRKDFIKDINALTGKNATRRKKKSSRNEASTEISEYTWSSGKDESSKLSLHDLLGDVKSSKNAEVKKKLRKMENTVKTLDKPLTKPETERVERAAAYKTTRKEISKWAPTIQKNRDADQLVFPLNQYKAPGVSTKSIARDFKPTNDLEREISKILNGSKHILERPNKELTAAEEEALKTFDLEDAMLRRKELQKSRALQSYYEAKCRRMKKIKSKKYHKIQRKAEQKALDKVDLEVLAKEQPELFQKEVEKAEKLRALERASLRHRNTSKWAKNLILKGNQKTKEDQERIREQLRVSRELTNNKIIIDSEHSENDEDKESENESTKPQLNLLVDESSDNPWLLSSKSHDQSHNEADKKYKKLEAVENKEVDENNSDVTDNESDDAVSSSDEWSNDDGDDVIKSKEKGSRNQSDNEQNEQKKSKKIKQMKLKNGAVLETKSPTEKSQAISKSVASTAGNIHTQNDAMRFLQQDSDAIILPTELSAGESSDDDDIVYDTEQRSRMREAFANDDVVADFISEKNNAIEKVKPKPVDLTLPGWGEWGGSGLKTSERKRKRFTKQPENQKKRKDEDKVNVIINEDKNIKLAKHMVSQIPFPYSSKEEFERSIRQPIGNTWNTPSVYSKLIEPRIKTNPGEIIEPIKASKSMKKKNKNRKK